MMRTSTLTRLGRAYRGKGALLQDSQELDLKGR